MSMTDYTYLITWTIFYIPTRYYLIHGLLLFIEIIVAVSAQVEGVDLVITPPKRGWL